MSKPSGILSWDLAAIAASLKIKPEDVRLYFTDGRRVSFLLERRLAHEVLDGFVSKSEGAAYDVIGGDGRKWEVRSLTRGGIYFCPSYMVGSGRSFQREGFIAKLAGIDGYIVSDIESFPDVPFWIIPKAEVEQWWVQGRLGASTKISRDTALRLFAAI